MARRLRIQYPGARYHVINRGNLQHDVFATFGATNAFLIALDEAAVQFGWQVHAHDPMADLETALHDELVGAIIPEAHREERRPDAEPGEFRIIGGKREFFGRTRRDAAATEAPKGRGRQTCRHNVVPNSRPECSFKRV